MMLSDCSWSAGPAVPTLCPGQAHVWCIPLNVPPEEIRELSGQLSSDEQNRAGRYHFSRDHDRFVVRRARLRDILSRYLGDVPSEIRYTYGSHGKPELDESRHGGTIRFNLSTSHDVALVAITEGRNLGVDVEFARPIDDAEGMASRYFTKQENIELQQLGGNERLIGFYYCWTRKEAILKAVGTGLSIPLDHVYVSVNPHNPVRWLTDPDVCDVDSHWSLLSYHPMERYVAALAVPGSIPEMIQWRWTNACPTESP